MDFSSLLSSPIFLIVVGCIQVAALVAHVAAPDSAVDKALGTLSRLLPGDMRGLAAQDKQQP